MWYFYCGLSCTCYFLFKTITLANKAGVSENTYETSPIQKIFFRALREPINLDYSCNAASYFFNRRRFCSLVVTIFVFPDKSWLIILGTLRLDVVFNLELEIRLSLHLPDVFFLIFEVVQIHILRSFTISGVIKVVQITQLLLFEYEEKFLIWFSTKCWI